MHKLLTKKRIVLLLCFLAVLAIGGVVGALLWRYFSTCKVKYSYINSSLGCSISKFNKSSPIVLNDNLNAFINSEKQKGNVSEVSVYFRDLKDGPVLGINENDLFVSASLLKLPIALTFYRLYEDGTRDILNQKIFYELGKDTEESPDQHFTPLKSAIPGSTYTVNDLIYYSLVYSDNASINILKTYLKKIGGGQDLVLETLKDLGLTKPTSLTTNDISTRGYASIFRQLYNASYLSNEDSEKVLSILEQSQFRTGIVAGVPQEIKVANKFGERDLDTEKQLHDCGIVYYPSNPYIVCVMTRGQDYNVLANVIKDISKMVYDEMNSRANSK